MAVNSQEHAAQHPVFLLVQRKQHLNQSLLAFLHSLAMFIDEQTTAGQGHDHVTQIPHGALMTHEFCRQSCVFTCGSNSSPPEEEKLQCGHGGKG